MATQSKKYEKFEVDEREITPLRGPYKIRFATPEEESMEVTVPKEVIEREARKRGISLDEFMKKYRARWFVNQFEGSFLKFVKKEEVEA